MFKKSILSSTSHPTLRFNMPKWSDDAWKANVAVGAAKITGARKRKEAEKPTSAE